MELDKIKIIHNEEEKEIAVTDLTEKTSPFKEILKKKDFVDYSISFNETNVSLDDSIHFLVSVKSVGDFHFFLSKENFDKRKLFDEISPLRDLEVIDEASAKEKVNKLLAIINEVKPLFLVFKQINYITKEFLSENATYPLFFFEKCEEKVEQIEEPKGGSNKFKEYLSVLLKEKLFVLFALVGGLIVELATTVGINYIYSGKGIAVFLFICALVGAGLVAFICKDILKKYKWNSLISITVAVSYVLGLAAGLGGYKIFETLQTEKPETMMPFLHLTLLSLGIGIAIIILIIASIIAIKYFSEKTEKKAK